MNYDAIRIVLVNTSHPGNIGGVARAMKTMCLSQLYLVAPADFPHPKARARASGAVDVLENAKVVDTLEDALVDCRLVVGASARSRSIAWPTQNPRQCAGQIIDSTSHGPVALVFGREASGLTNAELERCNFLVNIPANPDYSSLNLAAAVQVLAYEIHRTTVEQATAPAPTEPYELKPEFAPASADEMEGLYQHMEDTLVRLDFLDPANPRQLMRRLRRLFNRAQLDRMELNILRGILSAAQDMSKPGR
jgi:tRNA (cytidine32/uridine32-2'-O)-methyltransferase